MPQLAIILVYLCILPCCPDYQLLGVPKVADLLVSLFHAAKVSAGIALDVPLASIGLCMSGFLQERVQVELRDALIERDAKLAEFYYIDNDSPGSVYTAAGPAGGLVIICGTGTMAQLIDPHGKAYNCGGWGHMFGDEASAYDIASSAIRRIFHASDGYSPEPSAVVLDATRATSAMLTYFEVRSWRHARYLQSGRTNHHLIAPHPPACHVGG